jgi:hypothetical protein
MYIIYVPTHVLYFNIQDRNYIDLKNEIYEFWSYVLCLDL